MQQRLGRAGRDTRSLELKDFLALAADLHAHALDLGIARSGLAMNHNKNETRTISQGRKFEACRPLVRKAVEAQ
ncbi:hypothetical protein ACVIHH_003690 [Bradyrhizobium sp. USDA 4518]